MTEMNNEITLNIMTYVKIEINQNHNDLVLFVDVATGGVVQEQLVLEQVDWIGWHGCLMFVLHLHL
jgi:hypothetical protein